MSINPGVLWLLIVIIFLVTACAEKTPLDIVNTQLVKASDGKYRLESAGCRTDYYVNGGRYFDLPKLDKGLYLYYEDSNSQFPSLNFVDNRDGISVVDNLPILNVKKIAVHEYGSVYVKTDDAEYLVEITEQGSPLVIEGDGIQRSGGRVIDFLPVEWQRTMVHNYRNTFVSVADTGVEGYQAGSTPKLACIKRFAIYFLYENNKRVPVFAGESVYSYFILDINAGHVNYMSKDEFFDNVAEAHKAGNIYFVSSNYYYLREKELKGLRYENYYVMKNQYTSY